MGDNTKKKRPVVAIMTGSFHTENSSKIGNVTGQFFLDKDIDVRLYQGLDAGRFLDVGASLDEGFDSHYYSLFGYSKFDSPDIIIISFGTISAVKNPLSLREFIAGIPDVPIILLEDDSDVPGGIHITIDNYAGMRQAIEHLIHVHGKKDIIFVAGPDRVPDAHVRLCAYTDVMEENDIEITDGMIVYGDFTDNVDGLIEEALWTHGMPEAFACANDDMASSVYRVLRSRGMEPGRDVLVTGFDNTPAAGHMTPPLATVNQNFKEVSRTAFEKALLILEQQKYESATIAAEFMPRQSCGCSPQVDFSKDHMLSDWNKDQQLINRLKLNNMMSSLTVRNLFKEDVTMGAFFENLGKQLKLLKTERSYICLLDAPKKICTEDKMFTPDKLYLHMYQDRDSVQAYDESKGIEIVPGDLCKYNCEKKCSRVATFMLFYGQYQYGVFCVELSPKQMLFYYTISLEIGSGLRYLYLALDQKKTLRTLREKNQILDYTASHDTLTGYLNRAGVMTEAFSYMRKYKIGERFVAVMGDLDHLKQINDTFGHDSGDYAICHAANAIAHALPEGAPLGRTGGDEFTCFFHAEEEETCAEGFKKRVKQFCSEMDETDGQPFYIGVSIGCYEFEFTDSTDLPAMLKKADEALYEAKKSRRPSVIRE